MNSDKLVKSAACASFVASVLILLLKGGATFYSNSSSLFATLMDATMDISSSLINAIAVHISLSPPDKTHRFGYGKVQDLAMLAQGIFFIATASLVFKNTIESFLHNEDLIGQGTALWSLGLSTVIVLMLVLYQRYVISKSKAVLIELDNVHYASDLITNIAAIISIAANSYLGFLDKLVAILIGAYIAHYGYKTIKAALHNILDQEMSDTEKAKILEALSTEQSFGEFYDIKSRTSGNVNFVQLYTRINPATTIADAASINERIVQTVKQVSPDTEVTVHPEPIIHIHPIDN